MIADVGAHLAAEHPVGPAGVDQDDRQQEQRADQQEGLRAAATTAASHSVIVVRHDHRPQADREAEIGHREQARSRR